MSFLFAVSFILPGETVHVKGLSLAARYVPMASVAGDFYDFIKVDDKHLGILVADVSGHGVPASLISAMVKIAFASNTAQADNPAEVLSAINQVLCGKLESGEEKKSKIILLTLPNIMFFLRMDLKLKEIPRSVYIRYILLNIPALAAVILILIIIQHWVVLPAWLFWSIIGFWIIKDIVLFPVVWRAYDWKRPGRSQAMVGEHGVARDRLAPSGYVQVRGELWRAEKIGGGPPIEAGQPVQIIKMEGLTLFVQQGNETD